MTSCTHTHLDLSTVEDCGQFFFALTELCVVLGEFSFPVLRGVGHLHAADGVRGDVPTPHLQGDHGQREREHDLSGDGVPERNWGHRR